MDTRTGTDGITVEHGMTRSRKRYSDRMRVYVHGAGRKGRDAWPSATPADGSALFASLDFTKPMEENVASLAALAPRGCVVFAHSAGVVPAFLAMKAGTLSPRALVLVEPALYDIARGHDAIEHHIETMTRARALSSDGDLFGYWSIVRPLMFGGTADPSRWHTERELAASFEKKQPPWGFDVEPSAITTLPTLVVTGDWNAEYEAIAAVLVEHGASHRKLRGNTHRPQDHPGFETAVDGFLRAQQNAAAASHASGTSA